MAIESGDYVIVIRDKNGFATGAKIVTTPPSEDNQLLVIRDSDANPVGLSLDTTSPIEDDLLVIIRDAQADNVGVKFGNIILGYDCWHCFCGCCSEEDEGSNEGSDEFEGPQGITCNDDYCDTVQHWDASTFGNGSSEIKAYITDLGGDYAIFNTDEGSEDDEYLTLPLECGHNELRLSGYGEDSETTFTGEECCQSAAKVQCNFAINIDDYGDKISKSSDSVGDSGNRLEVQMTTYSPTIMLSTEAAVKYTSSEIEAAACIDVEGNPYENLGFTPYLDEAYDDIYYSCWMHMDVWFNLDGEVQAIQSGSDSYFDVDHWNEDLSDEAVVSAAAFKSGLCYPPQEYMDDPVIEGSDSDFWFWNSDTDDAYPYDYGNINIFSNGSRQDCNSYTYSSGTPTVRADNDHNPWWTFRYEKRTKDIEEVSHSEMPPYFIFPSEEMQYKTHRVKLDPYVSPYLTYFNFFNNHIEYSQEPDYEHDLYGIRRPIVSNASSQASIEAAMTTGTNESAVASGDTNLTATINWIFYNIIGWNNDDSDPTDEDPENAIPIVPDVDYYSNINPDFRDGNLKFKTCQGTFDIPLSTIQREFLVTLTMKATPDAGDPTGSHRSTSYVRFINIHEANGLESLDDKLWHECDFSRPGLRSQEMYARVDNSYNYFEKLYYVVQRLSGFEVFHVCGTQGETTYPQITSRYSPYANNITSPWDKYVDGDGESSGASTMNLGYVHLNAVRDKVEAKIYAGDYTTGSEEDPQSILDNITEVRYDYEHESKWDTTVEVNPTQFDWIKCIRLNDSAELDEFFRDPDAAGETVTSVIDDWDD